MILEPRPLWKLLIQAKMPNNSNPLSCADNFAILEYLADMELIDNDRQPLLGTVQQHLHDCPKCHDYYMNRLDELEHQHAIPTA